jgi:hypothetical protein
MVTKIKKSVLGLFLVFSVFLMFGLVSATDTNPVAVQGQNPVNYYNSTSSSVIFDFKCYDDVSVSMIQLWSNTTGTWQASYSNSSYTNDTWLNITLPGISDGQNYQWAVNCTDSGNNTSITTNRTFNVDATAPTASQGTNPVEGYNAINGSVTFDMQCSDNVGVSMIQLWTNTTGTWLANYSNSSYVSSTPISVQVDGIPEAPNYKWAVWCNDTSGLNYTTGNRTFSINMPVPSQGTNPVDNYNDNDGSVTFDMKCYNGVNVSMIQLWTNTTGTWAANYSNSSYTKDTWLNITVLGITNGQNYRWQVWCNDTSGYSAVTANRTFNVDKNPPVVTLDTPENGDEVTSVKPVLEYDIIDNFNLDICYLYINDVQKMEDDDLVNGSNSFTVSYSLGDGVTYDWYVKCYDVARNLGTSEEWSFTVNKDSGGGGSGGGDDDEDTTELVVTSVAAAKVAGDVLTGDKTVTGLVRGDRVNFTIGNATHNLLIINVTANYTTFEIRSTLITAIINVGETKSLDLDGNGKNDFAITVQGISALKKVNVILKSVKESASNNALTGNIVNDTNSSSNKSAGLDFGFISDIKWDSIGGFFVSSWIYLLVFVVVAGGVIVLVVFRDKVFKSSSKYWWRKGARVRLK